MKSKDWTVIIVIMFFSSLVSFGITNLLIGSRKTNRLKVEQVEVLTSEFTLPNKKYFNSGSINPTKDINIGEATNTNPFGSP